MVLNVAGLNSSPPIKPTMMELNISSDLIMTEESIADTDSELPITQFESPSPVRGLYAGGHLPSFSFHGRSDQQAEAQAVLHCFTSATQQLDAMWNETGTDTAHRSKVLGFMFNELSSLFQGVVQKESLRADELKAELTRLDEEAVSLQQRLDIQGIDISHQPSLTAKVAALKAHIKGLHQTHDHRLDLFRLVQKLYIDVGGNLNRLPIPSDISLLASLNETVLENCMELINVAAEDREKDLKNQLHAEAKSLDTLWDRLKVNQSERDEFLSFIEELAATKSNKQCITKETLSVWVGRELPTEPGKFAGIMCGCCELLEAVETSRMKKSKLEKDLEARIALMVKESKQLLTKLWSEYFEQTKDQRFAPARYGDISEEGTNENLKQIEEQTEKMSKRIESLQSVTKLLNKRADLLAQKKVMEEQANNPDRYSGKNFMQRLNAEQALQKSLKISLPKYEKQIKQFCQEYRQDFGSPFLYEGEDLEKVIDEQIADAAAKASISSRKSSITKKPSLPTRGGKK
eukprot:TRINITY_DN751_c3_g1_i1.p1 TRINITY_DN751_c3_g1~~TRINITY_DN751_c3_g1_i1.p1  ORF type:complete len:537 (+),score=155.80 TRINITY_DN751_c3_g1_i1:55-1611(+)